MSTPRITAITVLSGLSAPIILTCQAPFDVAAITRPEEQERTDDTVRSHVSEASSFYEKAVVVKWSGVSQGLEHHRRSRPFAMLLPALVWGSAPGDPVHDEIRPDAGHATVVPFAVSQLGLVELSDTAGEEAARVPPGEYALLCEMGYVSKQRGQEAEWCRLTFVPGRDAQPEILRADADLSPQYPLLMKADPVWLP